MNYYKEPGTEAEKALVRDLSKAKELATVAHKRNLMTRKDYHRLLCLIPTMTQSKALEWIAYFNKKGLN